jgi:hypothetical protein
VGGASGTTTGITNAPVGGTSGLGTGGSAITNNPPGTGPRSDAATQRSTTANAPGAIAGANSFTEGQARGRAEAAGYSQVGDLTQDNDGVWRGPAMHNGQRVQVGIDFQGRVSHR